MRNINKINFILILISLVLFNCKKEPIDPMKPTCCDSSAPKDSTFIQVENTGSTDKVFRIYGGSTQLDSVQNNGVTLTNIHQFTLSSNYEAGLYVSEFKFLYVTSAIFNTISNVKTSTNTYTWYAYDNIRKLVYAMDVDNNKIDVLNPASSNSLVSSIPIEGGMNNYGSVIYSNVPDRVYYQAFAPSGEAFVYVINPNNYSIQKVLVSGTPDDYTVSEYPIYGNNTVYTLSTDESNPVMMRMSTIDNSAQAQVSLTSGYFISSFSPILVNGFIYFIGRQDAGTSSGILYKYNISTNTFVTYTIPTFDVSPNSQLSYNGNNGTVIISEVTHKITTDINYLLSFSVASGAFTSHQIGGMATNEGPVPRMDNARNLIYVFKRAGSAANYVLLLDASTFSVLATENLPEVYYAETTYYITDDDNFQFVGSSFASGELQYFLAQDQVLITVNGGESTTESINAETGPNPICVCEIKIDTDNKEAYKNLFYKKQKNSTGEIKSSSVPLLSKYTAAQKNGVNTIAINGKEFATCVLDGFNYLEWTVPANSNVSLNVKYCQYDRSNNLLHIKKVKKKYIHGAFKYYIN